MSGTKWKVIGLGLFLLFFAACAPVQSPGPEPEPPPQNLLGTTDDLQLVVELSLDLARRHGRDQLLVVLDIDDTLLFETPGANNQASVAQPVQEGSAKQVLRMQDAGLKVIALTSQSPKRRDITFQQLKENNFNFQSSAWPPSEGYAESFIPEGGERPVLYKNGVYFVDAQDQGVMLKALLQKSGKPHPTLIVMADREQDHLSAVMKSFAWTGTSVHAWRYTRKHNVGASPGE